MGFDECWERVRQVTPLKKQTQLAEFLGINTSNISSAKARGSFPLDWAFKIAQKYKINTDWIMTGTGPREALWTVGEGDSEQYRRTEKEVDTGDAGVGQSGQSMTDEESAHRDLDFVLRFGNTYQRGGVKGYLNELAEEISEKIKRSRDKSA